MTVAFFLYGIVEIDVLGIEAYEQAMFIDYSEQFGLFLLGIFGIKLFHAFMMSYLHEKIPHCDSPMWERIWRFSLFSFFLFDGVGLLMTAFFMTVAPILIASWAVNGIIQAFVGSSVIIPILYKYASKQ